MSEFGKGGEAVWTDDKQKMIKELKDRGIYEDGMPLKEMTMMLEVVQQSLGMTNSGGQNINVNKTPEVARQENQSCYSRVSNSKANERTSMSPELSTSQFRKSLSQDKRSGESSDEGIFSPHNRNSFSKENKDIQPTNINKTRLSINENTSETTDNKLSGQRTNSQMRSHETPKCRVNPLDVLVNANDVPLQPHYHTLPEKDCVEVGTSVNLDKAVDQLTNHLQRIAELWHSQHRSSARARYPWGKVIQVDTDNGSSDKESLADGMSEDAGPSETNVSVDTDRRRRTCARKIVDYTAGELSDDSSDDVFEKASSSNRRRTVKRADASESRDTPKETENCEITKKRKSVPNRDDIYKWEAANEGESSDEEVLAGKKKAKPPKRADSSEKTRLPRETVSSQTTRTCRNDANSDQDVCELEPANEELSSDQELQNVAKRKKLSRSAVPSRRVATARSSRQKNVEPVSRTVPGKQDDTPLCLDDSDELTICDNEQTSQTLANSQRSRSEATVSSTSSSYPRRIVPPAPKGKFSGIRARKPLNTYSNQTRRANSSEQDGEDDEEVARTNRNGKGNIGLQESEITEMLENIEEEEGIHLPPELEIRPLRVSCRMKLQMQHLQQVRKEEEEAELKRAKEERIKEERIAREKQERIKLRLQEQNRKLRHEELAAKAKEETEARWSTSMKKHEKTRQFERTELNPEGPRQKSDVPTVEVVRKNRLDSEQNDVEEVNDENSKRVPCPICGKTFPAGQIEDHAASCEEYDGTNSAGESRSNSPAFTMRSTTSGLRSATSKMFKCYVCSIFSSADGKKLEDHVAKCLEKAKDVVSVGNNTVIEVPDSPIRGLRRASELTDSDINYKAQFVPKTKSHIGESRKRKRI